MVKFITNLHESEGNNVFLCRNVTSISLAVNWQTENSIGNLEIGCQYK